MATHLVWLRTDLRIHDNLALAAACRDPQAQVLALYIATPGQWREHHLAPRQAAFIASHLQSLHAALAERGIPLWVEEADDLPPASNGWPIFASSIRSVTCSTTISTNSMNASAMPPLRTPCAT